MSGWSGPTSEEFAEDLRNALRADLLAFAYWVFEGENGEGHEEEVVDNYLKQKWSER